MTRPLAALLLLATSLTAQDSLPARELLERSAAALGLLAMPGLESIRWTEVSLQRWAEQGADSVNADRIRQVTRRTFAGQSPRLGYRRYEQRGASGRLEWCEQTWIGPDGVTTRDCVVGDARRDSTPVENPLAALLSGFPHNAIGAMAQGRPSPAPWGTRTPGDSVWRLAVPFGTWEFDGDTWLPIRLVRPLTDPITGATTEWDEWRDYVRIGGVAIPRSVIRRRSPRAPSEILAITDLAINAPMPIPPAPSTAFTPRPTSSIDTIAQGLWIVSNVVTGYNAAIHRGDGEVFLIEAPGGESGAKLVVDALSRLGLDRLPLRVVVTHAHPDHFSALPFLPLDGATVLMPPSAHRLVATGLQERSEVTQILLDQDTVLTPGLALRLIDGAPHVDEMIVPVFPTIRDLYVADLVVGPRAELRPLGPETAPVRALVKRLDFSPRTLWLSHWTAISYDQFLVSPRLRTEPAEEY